MKSGIVTRRDPYLMDPSFMVDPNLILDYGSSLKGNNDPSWNQSHSNESKSANLSGFSILDELHHPYYNLDPLMDLINCNDTQLENIILNSGLCGDCGDNPWIENEFDLDEIFKDKVQSSEIEAQTQAELAALKQEIEMTTCAFNESDIANYEEVYADESGSVSDASDLDTTFNDNESVHSFCTESSTHTVKESTLKRTLRNVKDKDDDTDYVAPKRRKTTRRTKRVQDDRVKNQNKLAAMKYRKKKRDEKCDLDDIVELEEEKNRKLKASVEELKVNIDVLKELLGKYLSPSQLNSNTTKQQN